MWGTFFNTDGPLPAVYPPGGAVGAPSVQGYIPRQPVVVDSQLGTPTQPGGAVPLDLQLTGSAVNGSALIEVSSTGDGVIFTPTPPAAGGNCCDDCERHSLFRCFIGWLLVLIGLYVIAHAILIRVL